MVRQRHGFDRLDAAAFEGGEEARRMADAGHRHYVREGGDIATFAGKQVNRHPWAQPHRDLTRTRHAAVNDNRINALQARRPLAHRPGRQPPAVAKAAHAVNNDNFSVPRELIVLQPVVGHNHLQIVRAEQRFYRVAA